MVPRDVLKEMEKLGKRKILVGIPSYENASTIGKVAEIAAEGLKVYFNGDGILVNSDGGSKDGTHEAFMESDTGSIPKISYVYEGIPGKGSALLSLFLVAEAVDAEVVVLLDSDLRSVEPWWVQRLAKPIIDGAADYVAPYYMRHKYDATITNHVCYPMTSVLYGKRIRQPIGGDFGVGRNVYRIYLERLDSVKETNVARFGIDIWMTTTAIVESGRLYQAMLGAKVHDVKDPGKHLGPMFEQVVSTLFQLMVDYEEIWRGIESIEAVPVFGDPVDVELEEIEIDLENMKEKVRNTIRDLEFIDRSVIEDVKRNGTIDPEKWIDVVFSFALEYRRRRDPSLTREMIPFYLARVASFVESTLSMTTEEAEKLIEEQLDLFKEKKPDLIKRWFD